ncbi:hypothetical protein L1887_19938 [Cichorium endivia]|nr:hypothetical protein L1887_19938 [Cichorium endivia]
MASGEEDFLFFGTPIEWEEDITSRFQANHIALSPIPSIVAPPSGFSYGVLSVCPPRVCKNALDFGIHDYHPVISFSFGLSFNPLKFGVNPQAEGKRMFIAGCPTKLMDRITSGDDYENTDWDTEDELEIQNITPSSCVGELISRAFKLQVGLTFLGMGFSEQLIAKAIKENGEANTESILESLLTYSVLESDSPDEQNSCPQQEQCVEENGELFSDYDESLCDDLSDNTASK